MEEIEKEIEKKFRKFVKKKLNQQGQGMLLELDIKPEWIELVLFTRHNELVENIEIGKFNGYKRFSNAFSKEELSKIDFSNVSFKDFDAKDFDFTGLHNVFIDTREIYESDLSNAILNGVTFINDNALDYCEIDGANFTGSKNAYLNPNSLCALCPYTKKKEIKMKNVTFRDVTFTEPFESEIWLENVNFSGSKGARFNAQKIANIDGCKLQDATIIGTIDSYLNLRGTNFTGVRSESIWKEPRTLRINPLKLAGIQNAVFKDVVFVAAFGQVTLDNTDFTGSKYARIYLSKLSWLSYIHNCNFTDAKVFDSEGKELMISEDGKIIEEKDNKDTHLTRKKMIRRRNYDN